MFILVIEKGGRASRYRCSASAFSAATAEATAASADNLKLKSEIGVDRPKSQNSKSGLRV